MLIILLATRRWRRPSAYVSIAAVALSFVGSCILFSGPDLAIQFPWIDIGGKLTIPFGVTITALSKTMLLVVTLVGLLVHIYSLGYMEQERDMARYYGGLSLFMYLDARHRPGG